MLEFPSLNLEVESIKKHVLCVEKGILGFLTWITARSHWFLSYVSLAIKILILFWVHMEMKIAKYALLILLYQEIPYLNTNAWIAKMDFV